MKKINAFFWVKIAIALTLAIGIPAIGIAEEVYMRGAFDGVAADCEEIVALIERGDADGAASLAEALRSDWSQNELIGDLKADLDDDAIARAKMIAALAENSKNLLAFKWKNIL